MVCQGPLLCCGPYPAPHVFECTPVLFRRAAIWINVFNLGLMAS